MTRVPIAGYAWIGCTRAVIACTALAALFASGCSQHGDEPTRGVTVADTPPAIPTTSDFGVYNAVVIGIDSYTHWPRLKYAEGDANRIADLLTQNYGFAADRVTRLLGTNATRQKVLSSLRQKLGDMTERDNLLIYYAGHGQLDPLTKTGFWIPADGELYDESSWIPFSTITDFLRAAGVRAKNIIVVTDSCYGGALARGGPTPGTIVPSASNVQRYMGELARRAAKRSRQVLASGGYEQVPDESMFATLLERALQQNTYPAIDLELLFFSDIYPQIKLIAQQEPVLSRVSSGPDVDGQFVLLRSGTASTGTVLTSTSPTEGTPTSPSTETTRSGSPPDSPPGHPEETAGTGTPTEGSSHSGHDVVLSAAPRIESFTVTPAEVREGEKVIVSWQTADADKVDISDIGSVPQSGSRSLVPDFSKAYRIRATASGHEPVSAEQSVRVKAVLPTIEYFRASAQSVHKGDTVAIEWNVQNAARVQLSMVGGQQSTDTVPAQGRRDFQPSEAASFVLVAYNRDQERVGEKIGVDVTAAPAPPGGLGVDGGGTVPASRSRAGTAVWAGAVLHATPAVADACIQGYVWREAFDGDHVCVTPAVRTNTAMDNSQAARRIQPGGGAYGPNTCRQGFVWREARPGDVVCVTPATRAQAAADNGQAAARRVKP
jgi:Caspase domain